MKPSNPLVFEDGDVEICLSRKPQDRLLLHGTLLKIHSSFFKPSLGARWADSSVTDQAQGPIKGRYQLIFDTSETDTLPGLFRAGSKTAAAAQPSSEPSDPACLFIKKGRCTPLNDAIIESQMDFLEAYRQFFRLLYHFALVIPKSYVSAIEVTFPFLEKIVQVADFHGCSYVARTPIERILTQQCYEETIAKVWRNQGRDLLYIAIKTRSRWLFREIECRMIGDPLESGVAILNEFADAGIEELMLEKRNQVLEQINRIDHCLFTMDYSDSRATSKPLHETYATAVFREWVATQLRELGGTDFRGRYHKYRSLKDEKDRILANRGRHAPSGTWEIYQKFLSDFGNPKVDQKMFTFFFETLLRKAEDIYAPILKDVVKAPLKPSTLPSNEVVHYRGLLCTDITDDDYTWDDLS